MLLQNKYIISVSLRSIIHSYCMLMINGMEKVFGESFRLLTEYYSFLLKMLKCSELKQMVSFRLLTEYHSFLFRDHANLVDFLLEKEVSVSLRSIIHSYLNFIYLIKLIIFFPVSVSLRSIIHSYGIV